MKKPTFSPHTGSIIRSLFFLLLLGGAGVAGWWYWKQQKATPVSYTTVKIRRGDITQAVTATGTLNPVVNVQVGSQISGIIEKLHADFNSPVTAGQVVAQIDPATYEATVRQATGELENARAGLELAKLNEERARELHNRKAAAKSTLDQAVASLRQAEAQVLIREGALQRAKVDLDRCTILSPVDGIVISRDVDVGQTVAASLQAPVIFTIANDLTKMQINASVAEADVGNIREGQEVEFTVDAYPTETFRGKVTQVRNAPITVDNVVTYDTIIEVSNDKLKLKPGMTASTSIITERKKDTLLITAAALRFKLPEELEAEAEAAANQPAPADADTTATPTPTPAARGQNAAQVALQQQGGGRRGGGGGGRGYRSSGGGGGGRSAFRGPGIRHIYVLRDGAPHRVKIRTGISDGINTSVETGLQEGDLAITNAMGLTKESITPGGSPNPFTGAGMRRR